jgi:hypothetical protein
MRVRKFVLIAALTIASSSAFAQGSKVKTPAGTERAGTAEDQAACRPDVRKYCHALEADAGDLSFLACLKEHRDSLRKACSDVLEKNGQ